MKKSKLSFLRQPALSFSLFADTCSYVEAKLCMPELCNLL